MNKKQFGFILVGLVAFSVNAEEPKPVIPSAVSPQSAPPVNQRSATVPNMIPRTPNPEWISLLERLRFQPRAGEINNGGVSAMLSEIFDSGADAKAKAVANANDYEKALLEKAAKWESELKELRTQYEAKAIAELPESKREIAQKFLESSRSSWAEANARDTKMRSDFLERMRLGARLQPAAKSAGGQPTTPGALSQANVDANAWMREQRMIAMKQDEESVKTLRSLLGAEEAARFDLFNRVRPIPASASANRSVPPTAGIRPQQPGLPPKLPPVSFPLPASGQPSPVQAPALVPNPGAVPTVK